MRKPIAVIAGDIHFTIATLEEATKVVEKGLELASDLDVPLILNGDTLDGKAIIRAEIANRLLEIFQGFGFGKPEVIINVGNHDLINHAGREHALNFLYNQVDSIVNYPKAFKNFAIIPYMHNAEELSGLLSGLDDGQLLIMHQGVAGANMGHYLKDTASLPKAEYARFRVIASHYHMKQDIDCGPGIFSYIGSPYTTSFAEANDGPKGISIIYSDGSLELVPLDLRRHVIIERSSDYLASAKCRPQDLHWVKLKGTHAELKAITKKQVADQVIGGLNFKFDKIYTDRVTQVQKNENLTHAELFDKIIDSADVTEADKPILKSLWKDVLSEQSKT